MDPVALEAVAVLAERDREDDLAAAALDELLLRRELAEAFGIGDRLDSLQLRALAKRRHRDPRGKFADEISKLGPGGSFRVGNVTVRNRSDSRAVKKFAILRHDENNVRIGDTAVGEAETLRKALTASARDRHPDALGGRTRYHHAREASAGLPAISHDDLEKQGGKLVGDAPTVRDARKHLATIRAEDGPVDTQRLHKPGGHVNEHGEYVGGQYTPERQALHQEIVERHLRGHQAQRNREILFMGGGGASGKSSMLRRGAAEKPADSVLVNPDVIKGMLPEFRQAQQDDDKLAASHVHEESSDVGKMLMHVAQQLGMNITVDKTAIKPKDVERSRGLGYKPRGAVATVGIPTAVKRNEERYKKTKRYVDERHLMQAHHKAAAEFEDWVTQTRMPITLMDTESNRVIARADGGKLRVLDKRLYGLFRQRATQVI